MQLLPILLCLGVGLSPNAAQSTQNCALIISAPPRSSRFDQANHAFGGSPVSQDLVTTCVTFDAVNTAFERAKAVEGLSPVRGRYTAQAIGELGTIIHETTRYLAQTYGLSQDAVDNGLPLIDTTRTVINNYCPPFLMTPKCKVERYRSVEGLCNNIDNPHWGASMHGHNRLLPPNFADGISAPRVSVTGNALPSARLVSTSAHVDETRHDRAVTMLLVAWGQYIDHDITLSAEVKDPVTQKVPKCCDGVRHKLCLPIEIPEGDPFYSKYKQKCMNFVRFSAGLRHNCRLGPRESFNLVTSTLDAGTTYSNSAHKLRELRTFEGGKLKMLPFFGNFGMEPLLPLNLENPNEGCIRPSEDIYCFLSGDPRVNEQTILAMLHTIFAREHNRIVIELSKVNPHWNDETLFQEARHIVAALQQQFSYNEFLPMILGSEEMKRYELELLSTGYFNGYDPKVNPSVTTAFTTAVFRFGHSLLPSKIERWSKTHRFVDDQKLSSMLLQPYDLYKQGWGDSYLLGMINQVAQAMDDSITTEVQNHLFQAPGTKFGMDLLALNLQRGREHGLPAYTAFRDFCGLPRIVTFDDLRGSMPNETVNAYQRVYASPADIDLFSAGVAEWPVQGSMLGPTFACIMGKQFRSFRFGDRFWYENGGLPSSFTLEQLQEIRKIRLSRLICDNSDDIDSVQVYAMVLPDHDINPRVPCNSGILRSMDFTKWRDASFHSRPF
eukprot:snap_masked-scaffold181_size278858-processed-gene-1.12 protein:Tk08509 transcript:snap_masked-scaffold181_size278858-processed-gene-1.12-mRNA-1 annotation:"hypothetical protein DAPPUDRAFT_301956"